MEISPECADCGLTCYGECTGSCHGGCSSGCGGSCSATCGQACFYFYPFSLGSTSSATNEK